MTFTASLQRVLSPRWRAIDRRLNPSDIRSICLIVLATYSIILAVSFATQKSGRTVFGAQLGADFGAYYVAGRIFNRVEPGRIYDRDLQREVYQELFPAAPPGEDLPYVNAPFFILPFILLSRLPYAWAYPCWFLISLGLFVAGFNLIWKSLEAMPGDSRRTALLMGLSFMPFLVECLAGGQTSAVGFFFLALTLVCERQGRLLLSGIALAFCLYKPTLLMLVLPMLIVTRRYAALAGFAIGGSLLTVVSLLAAGWQGCLGYLKTLFFFAQTSTGAEATMKSWKYVDINSFFRLLLSDYFYLRWWLIAATFLAGFLLLVKAWRIADRKSEAPQGLVWAATITLTPVLNVYTGIYDATIVALGALLTTNAFYQRANGSRPEFAPAYKFILLLLYVAPWFTQSLARTAGIQIYTLVLAAFGFYQLSQLSADARPFQENSGV
ncbi:MAG: glycosyltransferase family 87 protein [Blastocatellales bacterium]